MSVTFFALTGTDSESADLTMGLEDYEFNTSSADAREIEIAINFNYGVEEAPAGELPASEFLTRVEQARGNWEPAKHSSHTNTALELAWYLADEAMRKGADLIAWS
jgi:hypothetical protein